MSAKQQFAVSFDVGKTEQKTVYNFISLCYDVFGEEWKFCEYLQNFSSQLINYT